MLANAQRTDMLAAMGVDVYRLRRGTPAPANTRVAATTASNPVGVSELATSATAAAVDLIVVCAYGGCEEAGQARLFSKLPQILGLTSSRIAWLPADAGGKLAPPPPAAAYLVLGQSLTRALGEQLSTKQQMQVTIAVADEAAQLARGGAGKRALWQVLKPIARALRAGSP